MNKVITINRQFASGGREIGKRLSEELKINYYDKDIIAHIADKTYLSKEYIEEMSEYSGLKHYSQTIGKSFSSLVLSPMDMLQIEQAKLIRQLAEDESCIIVGRCGNYILKEKAFKIFIYASDMSTRISRCYDKVPEERGVAEKKMEKQILAVDKQRSRYHYFYTGQEWMTMSDYDLCIDTSRMDIDHAVKLIGYAINNRYED